MLNYFGQGALLVGNPEALEAPFFLLAPEWAAYPLVALATVATVIASQAVISGAFSLTRQAVQLGYLPRMLVDHTSEREIGQIYMPAVNWALLIACIGLVLGFRSSSRLATAYGVAVTTDMVVHHHPLHGGGTPALGMEAPAGSPHAAWASSPWTWPSGAATSRRSPTAAGSPSWWPEPCSWS